MKASTAGIAFLIVAFGALGLPAIIGGIIGLTPNPVTGTADAGRFISASTSAGGFFSSPVTTVQTAAATVQVWNTFSALRGAPIRAVAKLKGDLELCTTGVTSTCSELTQPWPGPLTPVSYVHHWTSPLAALFGKNGIADWVGPGFIATVLGGFACIALAASDRDPDEPDTPAERAGE